MDVLGHEPEDGARPRTTLHVVRGLHATTDQKASAVIPCTAEPRTEQAVYRPSDVKSLRTQQDMTRINQQFREGQQSDHAGPPA